MSDITIPDDMLYNRDMFKIQIRNVILNKIKHFSDDPIDFLKYYSYYKYAYKDNVGWIKSDMEQIIKTILEDPYYKSKLNITYHISSASASLKSWLPSNTQKVGVSFTFEKI